MKKNILKKAGVGVAMAGLALLPLLALAQAGGLPGPLITTPTQLSDLIQRILNWVAGVVIIIALIMLIYSAILYITAGGSEDRVGKAKNYLIYAIVGIVVALLAFSVVPFLQAILGRSF